MRTATLMLVVLAASGCEGLLKRDRDRDTAVRTPTGPVPERTAKELVDWLNWKASLVQTLSYDDLSISASEAGRSIPTLGDSSLIVSQPRNVRLIGALVVGGTQLDIGSNDREFWMYVKQMPGDNYFYCSHQDFARGAAKLPMPFDTDWMTQALGMYTYPTDAQYQVQTVGREHVLTYKATTPTGQTVWKQTTFNAEVANNTQPVVKKHVVADESNRVLAVAEIRKAKEVWVGDKRAQIPTEAVLSWPQQKFEMRLTFGKEKVNEDLSDRAAMLFRKPDIRGTNPIDLATYQYAAPTGYNARGQAQGHTTRRVYAWPRFGRD